MTGPRAIPDPSPAHGPKGAPGGLDRAVEQLASRLRGKVAADRLAYALSEAANHSILWHAINLADLLVGLARHDRPRQCRALRRSTIQAVEQGMVNGPLKALIGRSRPTHPVDHPHRLRSPLTSSFPSGHATAGGCAAELLGADLGHRRAWWLLTLIVGWSRVHVGVHHPSDVLAGWLMGSGAARTAAALWQGPGRRDDNRR